MTTALHLRYSFEEYLRFEESAHERHEFVGGLILAMAGGSLEHGALIAAVIAALSAGTRGRPCRVFDSNARVRVRSSGNAYYPDASVVGGKLETDPGDDKSMSNPVVLVEVLSPSTEEYDRTDKLADYRSIDAAAHIVHVAHDEARIDVWTRVEETWSRKTYRSGESAALGAIGCTLVVDDVYRNPLE